MRIYSKRISVLGLTPNELSQLRDMMKEAEDGKVVHYSERQQPNGSFFGISVDQQHEYIPPKHDRLYDPQDGPSQYKFAKK